MNVSLKNIDAVSALLKVEIEQSDYWESWDKNLRGLRQKAEMPGFRKGMVPLGLIKKMYGKQTLVEEINKLLANSTYNYLHDNQIRYLGDLMPNETEQKKNDFDTDETFEFCFDIAMAPEFDIQLSKNDALTSYRITVDSEMVNKQVDSYRRSFGTHENADRVDAEDLVKGKLTELAADPSNAKEAPVPKVDGIVNEEALLMPSYLKGKMEQKKFLKAKTGDTIVFNPYKAYKGTEAEIASFLKIEKEAVKNMKSDFSFEIKEITRFIPAALDQELFDKVFEVEKVQDEADFRDRINASLTLQFASQTDYKLQDDLHNMLIEKAGDLVFADAILKRWLLRTNEKTTMEAIELEYPKIVREWKYQLAKEKLIKAFDIKVENEDVEMMAKNVVKMQLEQYGIYAPQDDLVEKYASELMKKQEKVSDLADRVLDEKVISLMKDKITIAEQEVTLEDFRKILEEQK